MALPAAATAELSTMLGALAVDAEERARVVRHTIDGALASVPDDVVSSFVPVNVYVAPFVIVGASFSLVMVIDAEDVFVENAVVPRELAVVA